MSASITIIGVPPAPGGYLVFSFSGFNPSSPVYIGVSSGGGFTAQSDPNGNGTYNFPDNDPAGSYTIAAKDDYNNSASATFNVGPVSNVQQTVWQGDASQLNNLQTNNYIPAGSTFQINMSQSLASAIFGPNLGLLSLTIKGKLESQGVTVQSISTPPGNTSATISSYTPHDVYLSDLNASGTSIYESGLSGAVVKLIIVVALVALGITLGVIALKISSNQLASQVSKNNLANSLYQECINAGGNPVSCATSTSQILQNSNPPSVNPLSGLGSTIETVAVAAVVGLGIYLGFQIVSTIRSKQPTKALARR